jgi:hypothetical protein
MSAWTIVAMSVGVYLVGAIGTARAVFTRCYKREYPRWVSLKKQVAKKVKDERGRGYPYVTDYEARINDHDAHWLTVHDTDVYTPTWWAAAWWPIYLPYALLIRPIGTVLIPLSIKWFTGPARRGVAS